MLLEERPWARGSPLLGARAPLWQGEGRLLRLGPKAQGGRKACWGSRGRGLQRGPDPSRLCRGEGGGEGGISGWRARLEASPFLYKSSLVKWTGAREGTGGT